MAKSETDRMAQAKAEVLPHLAAKGSALDRSRHAKRSASLPINGSVSLTNKQQACADLICSGISTPEAYRQTYNTKPTSKKETVYRSAFDLIRNPKVAAYIEQQMNQLADLHRMQAAGVSQFVIEKLQAIATSDKTPASTQVAALVALGKTSGLFVTKTETKVTTEHSLSDLEQRLRDKMTALKLINGSE